jgi:hypothetical protein
LGRHRDIRYQTRTTGPRSRRHSASNLWRRIKDLGGQNWDANLELAYCLDPSDKAQAAERVESGASVALSALRASRALAAVVLDEPQQDGQGEADRNEPLRGAD